MPWVLVGSDNVDFDLSTEMLLPDYDDDQTPEDEELPEGDTSFGTEIEELAKVWSYPDSQCVSADLLFYKTCLWSCKKCITQGVSITQWILILQKVMFMEMQIAENKLGMWLGVCVCAQGG